MWRISDDFTLKRYSYFLCLLEMLCSLTPFFLLYFSSMISLTFFFPIRKKVLLLIFLSDETLQDFIRHDWDDLSVKAVFYGLSIIAQFIKGWRLFSSLVGIQWSSPAHFLILFLIQIKLKGVLFQPWRDCSKTAKIVKMSLISPTSQFI